MILPGRRAGHAARCVALPVCSPWPCWDCLLSLRPVFFRSNPLCASPVALACVLACASVQAQDDPLTLRLSNGLQDRLTPAAQDRVPSFVQGERIEGEVDGVTWVKGDAEWRRHDITIKADELRVDDRTQEAQARGQVRVNRMGNRFEGPELRLNLDSQVGEFSAPTFTLLKNGGQGEASRAEFKGPELTVAHDVRYSSCPRPLSGDWRPGWMVRAKRIDLDEAQDTGVATLGVLEFQGVPVLAAPIMSFPLSDARKTGWLSPAIDLDNTSGLGLTVPFYWNIAPNRDATFSPTLMSKRGIDIGAEFRYLERDFSGQLKAHVMPSDRLRGRERWTYALTHQQSLSLPLDSLSWRLKLNRASDDSYWKDFPRVLSSVTPRLLPQELEASWAQAGWSGALGAYRWQTLQDPVALITPPYNRLPSLNARRDWALGPWQFKFSSELTRFERAYFDNERSDPLKTNGERAWVAADLSRRWQAPGWFVQPRARWHATTYRFDTPVDQRSSASRSVPTVSLDTGLFFERDSRLFGRAAVQTLEPRAFFTWTPYRDQSRLPNYDSGALEFGQGTLFNENSFVGNDRISDTRAVSLGIESRWLYPDSGAEFLRLGVAQRYLLQDQKVTLPGGVPLTQNASDVLLSLRSQWTPTWYGYAQAQFSPDRREFVRTVLGGRYSPGPLRTLTAAYRQQRDATSRLSEQLDLGWQWPLRWGAAPVNPSDGGQWYAVGRLNYSLTDGKPVDVVAGFEYDAGCWIGRVVLERLQTGRTEANQRILLQLEFNGLTRLGPNALQSLRENVPRYQYLREQIQPPSRFQNHD